MIILTVTGCCISVTGDISAQTPGPTDTGDSSTQSIESEQASTPEQVVLGFEYALIESMRAGESLKLPGRLELLSPVIDKTLDIPRMSMLLLSGVWSELSEDARLTFIARFDALTKTTYATRFVSYSGQIFELVGVDLVSDSRATVRTRLERPEKAPVEFTYQLSNRSGAWRVVNIMANGVSDLAIRRSQYARLYERGGLDAVISDVESEIGTLRGN